jgi:hypothetical protein
MGPGIFLHCGKALPVLADIKDKKIGLYLRYFFFGGLLSLPPPEGLPGFLLGQFGLLPPPLLPPLPIISPPFTNL